MEMSRRANEQRPVSSAGYGHDFCISCFDQVACSFHLQVDAGKRPPHQGLKLTKAWLNKIDPLVQRGAEGRTRRVEHHPRLLLPGDVDDGVIGVSRKAARHAPTADMAARRFVSRDTLWRLERGDPSVSLGTLAAAFVLQLHERIAALAAPEKDALALELDEQRLPLRIRRSGK